MSGSVRGSPYAMLLAMLLLGCGDPTGVIPRSAQGTYSLVRVNGGLLPALVAETPDQRLEVVSGELLVVLGGTFYEERINRLTTAGGQSTTPVRVEGTMHARGSILEVREAGGARYQGLLTASGPAAEISYTVSGASGADVTFTYRQRRPQ